MEYGYSFALMVYVEASARKYGDFMTFEQIKEVEKYGEVGYHSYGHPHMVGLKTATRPCWKPTTATAAS